MRFLALSLLALALLAPLLQLSAGDIAPIYDATRAPIPQGLPWYPVLVFGDNRPADVNAIEQPAVFYAILNEINKANPLMTIGLGDHVGVGTPEQYEVFYRAMASTRLRNVLLIVGNHDVAYVGLKGNSRDLWLKYMGPFSAISDDIPGWRIALLDSEGDVAAWSEQLDRAYGDLGDRKLILVFHRPLYPEVRHNLKPEHASALLNYINAKGWPAIMLQGHFHAWSTYKLNGTEFIISGGAGAPLYSCSDVSTPGAACASKYHYMYLVLYPDGTYVYSSVGVGEGFGALLISPVNSTAYVVVNTKKDVFGNPVPLPVRLEFSTNAGVLYVVAMVPPNEHAVFNFDGKVISCSEPLEFYAYIQKDSGALVFQGVNGTASVEGISISKVEAVQVAEISPPSYITLTMTSMATRTITTTQARTATETITTSVAQVATTTELVSATITVTQPDLAITAVAAAAALAIGALASLALSRRK